MPKALVTGGAGFIGSHVADALLKRGYEVVIYDNLSTGFEQFIPKGCEFIEGYMVQTPELESALRGCDEVFHFAGHADLKGGVQSVGKYDLSNNYLATEKLLSCMHFVGVKRITFASSSAVYGENPTLPTPESYFCPSLECFYSASKRAAEDLIHVHSHCYGLTGANFRFVSAVGERYTHGVVFDFVKKLKATPDHLDIIGDGTQQKSYLYIDDLVDGVMMAPRYEGKIETYNLGHDYTISVLRVAKLVIEEMGLRDVQYRLGTGSQGWIGDAPVVHLDTTKIRRLGWHSPVTVEEGIRRTVRWLLSNPWALNRQ